MFLTCTRACLAVVVCVVVISTGKSQERQLERQVERQVERGEPSEATKRLLKLCQEASPDLKALRSAIREGANVDANASVRLEFLGRSRTVEKNAIELAAIHSTNPELVQLLLDAGAEAGISVCDLAAQHNSKPEVVQLLLDNCSRPINPRVMLLLFTSACQQNANPAVVRWFIENRGQDPNKTDAAKSNMTPFQKACSRNSCLPVIKLLVEKGGSLKATRPGGISPVMFSAMMNTVEITQFLVDTGADVKYRTHKGMTAYLYAAVSSPYPKMFRFLVKAGADANARENAELIGGGGNAIDMAAALNKHEGIIAAILAAGTSSPPSTMRGRASLRLLIGSVEPSDLETVVGDGVQGVRTDGQAPLLLFAQFNEHPEVIQKLVDGGAQVNSRILNNNAMFLQIDPMRTKGSTALMLACHNELLNHQLASYIEVLLNAGADANLVNESGYTALMFIASRKSQNAQAAKVIRMLIEAGARPEMTDQAGRTAMQMATQNLALDKSAVEKAFRPVTK